MIIQVLVFIFCQGIGYSQNSRNADSLNLKSVYSSNTNPSNIDHQKQSANFYKTDSVFSLRSQKGYFPSLFHNFGEQATAPLRYKTKEWLITGAAVGITTTLISVS